ncbi:class I SAM-dependent methyltransferase [Staphylococcus massiliensis]|uniref:rRNA methylase n=1 Tax=Staphylococcus massiliensis S46 TaxID=1229783 RepID=K9ASH5_9STAP|nr:class I SAM-dependent methyltransferase [Staphylococcus massiliensis]EKU50274.1 hypothetical protein C273_01490 [Staphylococcus massiliensis S46]MCG3400805.1 methyltransferase domain-containing protein [Staphylococcus massiliensis]MCG3412031.1 methyltransferase domain-containing protein [Staphylococcus massiliensis]PNZ99946.1 methyltransferase domain-containing protein [Staphylococcus massiliensis CCUG 55927]
MIVERILPFAKSLITSHISEDSIVIDATCGNGLDTHFLAQQVPEGHVYGFDVQEVAIKSTQVKVSSFENVTLFQESHEHVKSCIPHHDHQINAAIFNLGYLPKGDKSITTKSHSTIEAIKNIFDILTVEGIIVIVIYPGHDEGKIEKDDVLQYLESLPQDKAHVLKYAFINQKNNPPFVCAIEKRA